MRVFACAGLGLCLLFGGCRGADRYGLKPGPVHDWARSQPKLTTAQKHDAQDFALLPNAIGFKLSATLATSGENILISPTSAAMTIAMLANGARGKTQTELLQALHVSNDVRPLNKSAYALMVTLHKQSDSPILISNSVWAVDGDAVRSDYKQTLAEHYYGSSGMVPSSQLGTDELNKWASLATSGLIEKAVDPIEPGVRAVILNATVFRAKWRTVFDPGETWDGDFRTGKGRSVRVSYMNLKDKSFPFYSDDKVACLMLPYQNEEFGMVLVLPNGETPEQFLKRQTWSSWGEFLGKLEDAEPEVRLPKWRANLRTDLKPALKSLGVKAFEIGDFSGISESLSAGSLVRVIQNCFLEVDEQGTRAAAVTDAGIAAGIGPANFIADRPFAYALIHRPTGAILFLGICNDPTRE